jgi:hypothetical protein
VLLPAAGGPPIISVVLPWPCPLSKRMRRPSALRLGRASESALSRSG